MGHRYIIGVGNYSMGDDGIGLRIVEYIAERIGIHRAPGVEAFDLAAETMAPDDFTPSLHEMEEFTPEMEES